MLVAGLKRYSTLIKHLKPRYIYFYRKKGYWVEKLKSTNQMKEPIIFQ